MEIKKTKSAIVKKIIIGTLLAVLAAPSAWGVVLKTAYLLPQDENKLSAIFLKPFGNIAEGIYNASKFSRMACEYSPDPSLATLTTSGNIASVVLIILFMGGAFLVQSGFFDISTLRKAKKDAHRDKIKDEYYNS